MRFRTTLILFIIFVVLLAAYLVFESRTKTSWDKQEREGLLTDFDDADIAGMSIAADDGVIIFEREDAGDWRIASPIEARADYFEVDNLARTLARLRIERIVDEDPPDPENFGIPDRDIVLWMKDAEAPVRIHLGMENPIDGTLFARREEEKRVVLLESSLKFSLEKTLFDFRKKDVFAFETGDIASLSVRAEGRTWAAAKKDDHWWITSPMYAPASNAGIRSLLDVLSALRATAFMSEDKSTADPEDWGLAKPDYSVVLSKPDPGEDIVFSLARIGEDVFVSTDRSPLVVSVESRVLENLDKAIEDFRDKKAADFNSWQADRVAFADDDRTIIAYKDGEGFDADWKIEGVDGAADRSRIESFLRKIEFLEAQSFVDEPGLRARDGLEPPRTIITIRVKPYEGEHREIVLHIGREDEAEIRVAVRNPEFEHHIMVDTSFLAELPETAQDWMPEEDENEDIDGEGDPDRP